MSETETASQIKTATELNKNIEKEIGQMKNDYSIDVQKTNYLIKDSMNLGFLKRIMQISYSVVYIFLIILLIMKWRSNGLSTMYVVSVGLLFLAYPWIITFISQYAYNGFLTIAHFFYKGNALLMDDPMSV